MLTKEQEEVLKYLLSLLKTSKLSTPNQIRIGAGKYNFCNHSSKSNISILVTLEELGYVQLEFIGHPDEKSSCKITLLNEALNYDFYEKEDKKDAFISSFHDIILLIIGGLITVIVEIIVARIV